jgi:phosphoglycolate phosphatase-like HAD superfamily hydrolase
MAFILFDYDGVLADTLVDLLQFGQKACDSLGVRHRTSKDDLATLEAMSFSSYGRACGVPEHLVNEFVEICLNGIAQKESPPALFDGLGDVIRHFAVNHKLAVVTTNSAQNVNAFLAAHGLESYIHAVYGMDTPGSKAQKISLARDRFMADAKQTSVFMVGDSLSDVHAAREASATSIAVTWGHQSLDYLLRGTPDHVVTQPQELVGVIENSLMG